MPNCMGAGPPAGDRSRRARQRSSDGGGFQEVAPERNQPARLHVHDHVRHLEHGVAHERLVASRPRLHLDEDHLVVDSAESVDLDPDRPAYLGLDDALIGGLEVDRGYGVQIAELLFPGEREGQPIRPRVDEGLEALLPRRIAAVRHGDLHEDLAHPRLPPWNEFPDAAHTRTSLQYLESSYHGPPCPPRPAAPARSPPCTASSS